MLHLFKKVYITTEKHVDLNIDRVVIGENGVKLDDNVSGSGVLLAYGLNYASFIFGERKYSSFIDMFDKLGDHCGTTGKRVVIYVDDFHFSLIMAYWYRLIFANPDKDECIKLYNNSIFRYELFFRGRYSRNHGNTDLNYSIDTSTFSANWKDAVNDSTEKSNFITKWKADLGIEFLLATYYNNGDLKTELKSIIKHLMKKDLEKYLFELKEFFFIYMFHTNFTDELSLAKTYTWDNQKDILSDTTTYGELFLNDRFWSYKNMNIPSTGENINFDNITNTDVINLKQFVSIAGAAQMKIWDEEQQRLKKKIDFIDIYTDFTDERFADLINEISDDPGSFFSIEAETVNNYLIQTILENKTDQSFLSKYSIT